MELHILKLKNKNQKTRTKKRKAKRKKIQKGSDLRFVFFWNLLFRIFICYLFLEI